ncbi:hypothetical protein GGE45_003912 [Rhizobium aethiopicum]|uniref:hypothetical protein n=1 Tax=Rhizobium aethiopicum TaxID=1138170 RepID=UPI00161A1933|nr:hypothetical protein [Rhizobium aethiopicum]MBB4581564.1 hypothetical protein [Rhizobium aethiopicum]
MFEFSRRKFLYGYLSETVFFGKSAENVSSARSLFLANTDYLYEIWQISGNMARGKGRAHRTTRAMWPLDINPFNI